MTSTTPLFNPGHSTLERVLVALPVASLVLAALAWLRFGIDLPWYDDWRGYEGGWIQSLGAGHLFSSINYTLSPVGLALDALVQRTLDGNAIAYQLLSMLAVLGSLLVLQWRLLMHALGDRLQAAACFTLTLLMLQPGSYWGLENLAYHQALPLVFLLWAFWLMTSAQRPSLLRGPAVALLGLLGGFSYISGALGGLAAGVVLVLVLWLSHSGAERRWRMREAAWFTVGAAVAAAAQLSYSFWPSHTSPRAIPLALPTQLDFWWYALGKVGRSLLLPAEWPALAVMVTLLAIAAAIAAGVLVLRAACRADSLAEERRLVTVFLPLAALLLVYLALVAAGRALWRPPDVVQPLQVFSFGFLRFHFFWLTLLWPWALAAWLLVARRRGGWHGTQAQLAAPFALLAVAALLATQGAFAHMAYQRDRGVERDQALHCLVQELHKGGPVRCVGLLPPRPEDQAPDARPAIAHALRIGASFVRQLPAPTSGPALAAMPKLFDLDGSAGNVEMRNLRGIEGDRFEVTGPDPQMFLNSGDAARAAACATIQLVAQLRVPARDSAQLYWGDPSFKGPYAERQSGSRVLEGGADETVVLRLHSRKGFHPSWRFDPVGDAKTLELRSLKVYCVQPRAHQAPRPAP
jgi:hypothetical protein